MLDEGAIPLRWLGALDLCEVIEQLVDDFALGYRAGQEWWTRYPRW